MLRLALRRLGPQRQRLLNGLHCGFEGSVGALIGLPRPIDCLFGKFARSLQEGGFEHFIAALAILLAVLSFDLGS